YQDNGTLYTTSLGNFSPEETKAYLNARGITDDDKIQSYRQVSQGLPYYLYLLTAQGTEGDIDPGASVVENVLRSIPREEKIKRRLAWQAALLTKPFNQDDLEALPLFKGQDRFDLYDWF